MQFGRTVTLSRDGENLDASVQVVYDFDGGSKYLKVYIPETDYPDAILAHILDNAEELAWAPAADVHLTAGLHGTDEEVSSGEFRFSGRVLVWTPSVIDKSRWMHLAAQMTAKGLALLVRDGDYVKVRAAHEVPLAFISHDSRDKDVFVRELANKLASMACPVWYDEFNLRPGDSLRDNIEKGLKAAPKCIVVLSKNFFSNPGWGKREFDSIYTREIVEGKRVMIPIWLEVSRDEVYDYSPILVDTLGINAALGVDEVARQLFSVLR